jgi:hypothetical protein
MHTSPTVEVSWGELFDKITILEIKERRLGSPQAVANVKRELAKLAAAASDMQSQKPAIHSLKEELQAVNESLWEIEDQIRAKEAAKEFDAKFIELARAVYLHNDKRFDIKRRINVLTQSELVEEKQYVSYREMG